MQALVEMGGVNGKGSGRRRGANDDAFKRAPWPPPSPLFRKMTAQNATPTADCSCILQHPNAHCDCGQVTEEVADS